MTDSVERPGRMAKKDDLPGARLCARCGQMFAMHHTANYADGPFVGVRLEICPTAVFEPRKGEPHPLSGNGKTGRDD